MPPKTPQEYFLEIDNSDEYVVGAMMKIYTFQTLDEQERKLDSDVMVIADTQRAVAIAGGRFIAVGDNAEIRALANARTTRIDMGGSTVLPGFIDAHSHPASAGRRHLTRVDCDLRSIAAIQPWPSARCNALAIACGIAAGGNSSTSRSLAALS
jgi:alpha-D-ribose 1-methylphosphonate 5-triphosphate diphosphatase PhnM